MTPHLCTSVASSAKWGSRHGCCLAVLIATNLPPGQQARIPEGRSLTEVASAPLASALPTSEPGDKLEELHCFFPLLVKNHRPLVTGEVVGAP